MTPPSSAPAETQAPNTASPASSPEASVSATPSGNAGSKPPGTFIAGYKGIDITTGYFIDFTDNPERPQKAEDGAGGDLLFSDGNLEGDSKFGEIERRQSADYATCHKNTKYEEEGVFLPDRGTVWCVYTESGLLGIVTIKAVSDQYITFDLKVWQGPAD
ncbi:hypothetical protein [Actinomadura chokoriensis]|uniref:Uncharacterized protein n=1 Tax=Actinomadura chokoriensis TaxID=454156 RepID=A0ABV4QYT0_9ACTN